MCTCVATVSVLESASIHQRRSLISPLAGMCSLVAKHLCVDVVECMNRRHVAMGPMKLGLIAKDLTSSQQDDGKTIDFTAAGLYLPAVQTVFATVLSSSVSILACWLIPLGAISAVRTLALTVTAGVLVVRKPVRVGNTKGVNTIFAALRPCCFIYTACLVLEQLVHTCVSDESTYEHGFWRRIIYHSCMTVMTLASFMRSKNPRSESDLPFLVSTAAMLAIALLPPPALALSGPLCSPPTLLGAGERLIRAFLFSCLYVVLVYSAAPISNNLADTLVCIARSSTASCWVLGAIVYSIPLAIPQVCIILYFSFSGISMQYEGVSLATSETDPDLEMSRHVNTEVKDMRACTSSPSPSIEAEDHDPDHSQLHQSIQRKNACFQAVSGGGLTFNLSSCVSNGSLTSQSATTEQQRMAEVAATIQ